MYVAYVVPGLLMLLPLCLSPTSSMWLHLSLASLIMRQVTATVTAVLAEGEIVQGGFHIGSGSGVTRFFGQNLLTVGSVPPCAD